MSLFYVAFYMQDMALLCSVSTQENIFITMTFSNRHFIQHLSTVHAVPSLLIMGFFERDKIEFTEAL